MADSLCELVSHQMNQSEELMLLCDWMDQGIQFWVVLSTASENNQIIVGMFLGGLLTGHIRRFYCNYLRKRLLKIL